MKVVATAAFALLLTLMSASPAHGQSTKLRQKQKPQDSPNYAFLISNISDQEDWCLTSPPVDEYDFRSLQFKPCDFSGRPKNQLWSLDASGKIHSALNYEKCMVVDHGTDIFDGVRVKMARCDLRTSLNRFTHSGGSSKLKVLVNEAYCITNRGNTPSEQDTIHAKPCQEGSSAHVFTYRT